MVFYSFVNEFVDFIWYFLSLVEQSLFLVVLPVESQVLDPNSFPKIAQLSPSCIYNSGDFVRHNELEILKNSQFSVVR
jgi:hypothetical protein